MHFKLCVFWTRQSIKCIKAVICGDESNIEKHSLFTQVLRSQGQDQVSLVAMKNLRATKILMNAGIHLNVSLQALHT